MTSAETLLVQATQAHQAGDLAGAEKLYRVVLAENPNHADACALLGVVIGASGDIVSGVTWADKAVAIDPSSGLLRFHYGTLLMAAQRLPQAVAELTRAVALQPGQAQFHYNLANALRASNDWAGAITHYRESITLNPQFLDAYNNLALSFVHEKRYDEARHVIEQSLIIDSAFGDGWLTLCNVAEKLKNYGTALAAGQRAVALKPRDHYAWFGLGVAYNRLDRDIEAVDAYKRALELNPDRADIWDNLAQSYQAMNELALAEQAFRKAVVIEGQAIADDGIREIAEEEYGNRHWHLALIELLQGKYKQGFARYRARVKEIPALKRPNLPMPLWCGEDLRGKTLLVRDEQGYGDTLMLARFLPMLRAQGARVIFSLHKVLAPLFIGWDGADQIITHDDKIPTCDFYCSSFDLPHQLGVTLQNLPHAVPYVPALPPDAATILPATPGKKRIGVVWGGSPLHLADQKRSIPLPLFACLFDVTDTAFYCFNRDLKLGDAEILPTYKIENLIPLLMDFAAASRLVGQMDLIITCDTATAHLAGAMGKNVWLLLPFSPDWRWLTDREDSPWYPTMRLFRQPKPGDWESVVAAVKRALQS